MRLLETIRARFGPKSPRFFLAAFGKHPGWDDHLDDVGLETDALLAAKHFIYNQGIGGVLDSGEWEKYGENALPDFDHLMVWLSGDEMLAGRIWSSSDGKGRTRFPMNLCAQINNGGGVDRLPRISGLLSQWQTDCQATDQAADIHQIVNDGKAFAALAIISAVNDPPPPTARQDFAQRIGLVTEGEGAARLLYAIKSYSDAYAPTNNEATRLGLNMKLAQTRLVPQHFRFRADAAAPEESVQFWNQFLLPHVAEATPRLFLVPRDQPWVDIILGLPTPKHLACIKATPQVLPLTSDIPFGLDPAFRGRATATFRKFLEPPPDPGGA